MSAPQNPRRPKPSGLNHADHVARREIRVVKYVIAAYKYSANGDLLAFARMPLENPTGDGPDTDQKAH
ncbi:MAG: hypothetical protein WD847_15520 [Pirellulales bacterium]